MFDGSFASGMYIIFMWIYTYIVNRKQEPFRQQRHIYTLKQQEPVTDEHTAFMLALLTVVLAEKIFKVCCCLLSLTIYSHLIPPEYFPSYRSDNFVFPEACSHGRSQINRPVPIRGSFSQRVMQKREKKQI